jgi:predicted Co/Zn/Cd cation transporter (cation efflux family)
MNEKKLTHISVASASLHGFLVAFVLSYPAVLFILFLQRFDPRHQGASDHIWWGMWLIVPLVLAVLGTMLIALSCITYNLSARLFGGVRYTARE